MKIATLYQISRNTKADIIGRHLSGDYLPMDEMIPVAIKEFEDNVDDEIILYMCFAIYNGEEAYKLQYSMTAGDIIKIDNVPRGITMAYRCIPNGWVKVFGKAI